MTARGTGSLDLAMRVLLDVQDVPRQVQQLGEDFKGLKDNAAAAGESLAKAAQGGDALAQSFASFTSAQRELDGLRDRVDRGVASLKDLADVELQIDQAMRKGTLAEAEQVEMLAQLDAQEKKLLATHQRDEQALQQLVRAYDPTSAALKKLAADEARLTAARDAGRISQDQYTRAMGALSSQRAEWEEARTTLFNLGQTSALTARSLAAVTSNLARGDISGAGSSLLTISGREIVNLGLLGGAAATAAAAVAVLVAGVIKGQREFEEIDRLLEATGHAAGLSAEDFTAAGRAIDATTGTVGKGRDALLQLVQTGEKGGQAMVDLGKAAVAMSELTGRSAADVARDLTEVLKNPTKAAADLNAQYHFLTAAEYERIAALQAEGREQEAAALLANRLADVQVQRLDDVRERAGWTAKAWKDIKDAVSGAWEEIKNLDGHDAGKQLEVVTAAIAKLRDSLAHPEQPLLVHSDLFGFVPASAEDKQQRQQQALNDLLKQQAVLQAKVDADHAAATTESEKDAEEQARIEAESWLNEDAAHDRAIAKARALRDLELEIAKIRKGGGDSLNTPEGPVSLDDYERRRKAEIDKKYADPVQAKTDNAFDQKKVELTQALAKAQQDLANAQSGEATSTDQATTALNAWLEANKNAKGLTDARIAQLRDLAAATDKANAEKQGIADAKQLQDLQAQLLRAQGNDEGALQAEFEHKYGDFLKRLQGAAKVTGEQLVQQLFSVEEASTTLNKVQRTYQQFTDQLTSAEQRLQIERDADLITPLEFQRKMLALRQQEIDQLQVLVPQLEAAARALGDSPEGQKALANVDELKNHLLSLQHQASELQIALRDAFEGGAAQGLDALLTGTESLRGAVVGFLKDMAQAMAHYVDQLIAAIAYQKLLAASKIIESALGLGGGGPGAATDGGGLVGAGGVFAAGGWTGPGGRDEPAGTVHRDEYVQPKYRMQEPGALAFMEAFRAHGMAAIDDWRGYAGGGLVGGPEIRSAADLLPGGGVTVPAAQIANNLRILNLLDVDDLTRRVAATSHFEKSVVNVVKANSRAVRESLAA